MRIPSQQELDSAAAAFDLDWGGVDDVLYGICRSHPGHASRRNVTAKIALIGRAYSAGLERCVTPPEGQQAISVIAEYVHGKGAAIDAVIGRVLPLTEPLTAADFRDIVAAHGAFLELLHGITRPDKTPRSFAAKYLHFHNPAVPIYDEYARISLTRLVRWQAEAVPFPLPPGADRDYWEYCVRFARLYAACWGAGVPVTVKGLDQYLWAVPTTGA